MANKTFPLEIFVQVYAIEKLGWMERCAGTNRKGLLVQEMWVLYDYGGRTMSYVCLIRVLNTKHV